MPACPRLWQFVQDRLAIAKPEGSYELGLRYRAAYSGGALDFQADDLGLGFKDIVITGAEDGKLLGKLATVAFTGGSVDLAQRKLAFKDIRLADGALDIVLDEDSVPDWARLVRSAPADAAPVAEEKAAPKDAKSRQRPPGRYRCRKSASARWR